MSGFVDSQVRVGMPDRRTRWTDVLTQKISITAARPEGIPLWNVVTRIFVTTLGLLMAIALPMAATDWMSCYFSPPASMTTCNEGLATCFPYQCVCSCAPWIANHACYRLNGDPPGSICASCP